MVEAGNADSGFQALSAGQLRQLDLNGCHVLDYDIRLKDKLIAMLVSDAGLVGARRVKLGTLVVTVKGWADVDFELDKGTTGSLFPFAMSLLGKRQQGLAEAKLDLEHPPMTIETFRREGRDVHIGGLIDRARFRIVITGGSWSARRYQGIKLEPLNPHAIDPEPDGSRCAGEKEGAE